MKFILNLTFYLPKTWKYKIMISFTDKIFIIFSFQQDLVIAVLYTYKINMILKVI